MFDHCFMSMKKLAHLHYSVKTYQCVCLHVCLANVTERKEQEWDRKEKKRQFNSLLNLSPLLPHPHLIIVRKRREKNDRSVNLNFAILAFFIFRVLLSWGKIDSSAEYYGFHKALLLRGHRDKPGQFQAGILDSCFIWRVFSITIHSDHPT